MAESSLKGRKLWENEKLLVTSNFSFSHSVFKRLVLRTRKNLALFGKGLMAMHGVPLIEIDNSTTKNAELDKTAGTIMLISSTFSVKLSHRRERQGLNCVKRQI